MKYKMKLNDEPYKKIAAGLKKIELRLNDEKRQLLKVQDQIEFTNRKTNETLVATIENLYHFPSFAELYKNFDKESLGYDKDEEANPSDMAVYYSPAQQAKYGVLAIKIKVKTPSR